MDRFEITYDEKGQQNYNPYIGKIAAGINTYWERRKRPLENPGMTYGLIHRNKKLLEDWERALKKEGLL